MRKYVLDLSEIYSDHRRKAYLGHRPTWTTIHTLIQTVRQIFGITSHVHVCSTEQIFYPDSESVEILRDGETLKILPQSGIVEVQQASDSDEDVRKANETNNTQESTVEDIESFLCSLPKAKRRRVRKRKTKKGAQDELDAQFSSAGMDMVKEGDRSIQERKANLSEPDRHAGKSVARKLSSSKVDERPYRNLNRQLKARVVRAVSLSTLSTPPPDDEPVMSPPSELNGATGDAECNATISLAASAKATEKARVVRAISLDNTVEVKREMIEVVLPLPVARTIKAQMGNDIIMDITPDEPDVQSLTNDDMETYSTIISEV